MKDPYNMMQKGFSRNDAVEQVAWERRQAVLRAFRTGATRKDMAVILGVSYNRVCQMIQKAEEQEFKKSPLARLTAGPVRQLEVHPDSIWAKRPEKMGPHIPGRVYADKIAAWPQYRAMVEDEIEVPAL